MDALLDPIPISALQHWSYCQRQCALIHQEHVFSENIHTLRGQAVHARVDLPGYENRAGCRTERSLPLWSDRLGLVGKADVVEFLANGTPYPVEYKHGRLTKNKAKHAHDELQLAAQAICLEEMTGHKVPEGAIFQASSKKRRVVPITAELRELVVRSVGEIRKMLISAVMPPPLTDTTQCKECSLIDQCQPQLLNSIANFPVRSIFDPDG